MKTFNGALGLLTIGIILIVIDISVQAFKPSAKPVAITIGLIGTFLIIVSTIMLFSIKSQIQIK